jgi:glycosyltransferase involved in cell wall biosynthesis
MKVCIVGNDYKQQFPLLDYGGIEVAFENLCKGVHKHYKDKIKFCAFVPKILENKDTTLDFKVIETNYIESSKSGVMPIHFVTEVKEIIKCSNLKPDVIWSYSNWSAIGLQDLNIPIICTIMDSGGWEENKFFYKKNIFYRFASKFIFDLVFKDAGKFEHINKIKEQSFWLHTGLSDDEYDLESNKEDYILWVAGLNWGFENKGLNIFLELAKRRPDQNFVAYGTGNPELEQQLYNLTKEVKNFNYLGTLKRGEQHQTAFKKAKLFTFLTQIPEAFGRTGLEAISKGTPVLGSTKGAVPELYAPAGLCTDNIDDMVNYLDVKHDYNKIYNYAEKFHIKSEIKSLVEKSKVLI